MNTALLSDAPPDPVTAAKAARLRYISDTQPGIRRERHKDTFQYIGVDGEPVTDEKTLARIRSLAIPPAYTDVWICPIAHGHLQATGRDAKGRKQYRYHERWRNIRDETKYDRMLAFGNALPAIRERVHADLSRPGLPREKVLATVVRLLEATRIRVGNEEYARANNSFGLTTLRNQHVDVAGSGRLHFHFRGKSGKDHEIALKDARVARIVKRCQDLPGQRLFEYLDSADGTAHEVSSGDINDYLREISDAEFTAKDFRTWSGTVLCALSLLAKGPCTDEAEAKTKITAAIVEVASRLGNTPAVCRKSYIHPGIIDSYRDGTLYESITLKPGRDPIADHPTAALSPEEAAVLTFLEKYDTALPSRIKKVA